MRLRKCSVDDLLVVNRLLKELKKYHEDRNYTDGVKDEEILYSKSEFMSRVKSKDTEDYLLVNDNGDAVGLAMCVLHDNDSKLHIENICISDDYRRYGYGTFILNELKHITDHITLSVYNKNRNAINFYKSNKFNITINSNKISKMEYKYKGR